MATIYIDNKPYEVKAGENLLKACLTLGFDVPYFCWHPAMHSVGACRQCAVKQFKDENDTRGKIVMACMTPATDGARISIDDPEAKAFRKDVIEWLMTNHPHDCPVCDEGGECHLQDMTVMTGHARRRFRFRKKTYDNQYLGPFLNHEMNRCIQCYRCVRFYRGYAGGRDLDVFASRNNVYFGRHEDGVLENEFSGNLAEVCPTGVFTDKTFKRHYTRKWDLQTAPSVCVHCSVGCNTIPGERYGELRRIRNRYNGEVNRYFLCDRGRFGYEFVNSGKRIRKPLIKVGGERKTVTEDEAVNYVTEMLRSGKKMMGIGSPRASLEANFALRKLAGTENFYSGVSGKDSRLASLIIEILKNGRARSPSLSEMEQADAVFVIGEDVTNTAPMMALALRQSSRRKQFETADRLRIPYWDDSAVRNAAHNVKSPFYIITPYATKLEDAATAFHHASPDDIARIGFAVAHEIDKTSPAVDKLPENLRRLAVAIADSLKGAKKPLIVSGTGAQSEAVIQAAANVAWALSGRGIKAGLSYALPECNTFGLGLMEEKSLEGAFRAAQEGAFDSVIILENDLYRRADENAVDKFLDNFKNIIAIDHLINNTTARADVLIPAATFAEADGTLVNNEGRAQRFFKVYVPEDGVKESWRWIKDLGGDAMKGWESIGDITAVLAREMDVFSPALKAAPSENFRIAGMRIARQPHRYSGRTAVTADKAVFETKPPEDNDSPFSFSMEGFQGEPPSPLIPRFWAPGWNSAQAVNKFQSEIGGPLHGGDPGQRLIEPAYKGHRFFTKVPKPFSLRKEKFLFISAYHIFGSEELSVESPGIAELAPRPYLGLNPADASRLGVNAGEEMLIDMNGIEQKLPVKNIESLPEGVAALPVIPGVEVSGLPAWGRIFKTFEAEDATRQLGTGTE